jgi:hypothetical protein
MEEMDSIEENGTCSLIDLPLGRKSIRVKWVFKVKRDEHGKVSKHKAHLVVKGYAQTWHRLRQSLHASGSAGLGALAHRSHDTRGVGGTPYEHQINVLE